MARRTPGSGSVYTRKTWPRGTKRHVARIELDPDPTTGKRRQRQSYHATKEDAAAALSRMQQGYREGRYRPTRPETVKAYLETWLKDAEAQLAPKTYADYRRFVEDVLIPRLGDRKIETVARADAQALVSGYRDEGKGATWLAHLRGVARKAWNDAIDLELVTVNPFNRLRLPPIARRRFPVLSPDQVRTLFDALRDDDDRNLYVLAVFTGARAGELLALTWDDVALDAGTVTIGKSVSRVDTKGLVVKAPKTAAGWRTIAIHPLAVAALRDQQDRVAALKAAMPAADWHELGLVFPQADGRHRYVEFPRKKLRTACETLKYPVLRFHDLRHLHAVLLIALGVHAKVISERLGHSRIDVTLNTYGHLLAGVDQDASDRLGALLAPAPKGVKGGKSVVDGESDAAE